MPRILVIDGNRAATRAQTGRGRRPAFGRGLRRRRCRRCSPACDCDIVRPADEGCSLPAGVALADYDGAAITGSALNVYCGGAHIERQVELARAVFDAGVPCLRQLLGPAGRGVAAAGGNVRANPRGREFGFGRRIALTEAGRAHPMFAGKPEVFEAVTVHRDEIGDAARRRRRARAQRHGPAGRRDPPRPRRVLGRAVPPGIQLRRDRRDGTRYGDVLVNEGLFRDRADLDAWAAELRTLQRAPDDARLAWRHGLGPAMRDPRLKLAEISNWLQEQVRPARARRG